MSVNVLIGIPHSNSQVDKHFSKSLAVMEKPMPHNIVFYSGYSVAAMRETMAKEALRGGYSHLLMLDSDMVYPKHTLTDLIEADKDIVGGWGLRRWPPHIPLIMMATDQRWVVQYVFPATNGLQEVGAVGGAGTLIKREVFEKVHQPWFSDKKRTAPDGVDVSEDVYFCQRARDAGVSVWCKTDLVYGHMLNVVLTPYVGSNGWEFSYIPAM